MPNRLIKDSIRLSEKVNSLSDFQFRLWISLITYVDDYGRGDARPAVIKGTCFPLRDRVTLKDIDAALQSLAGAGCVGLYEVDGKPYLYFPRWESHQTIRNKKSKFPAPDGNSRKIEINCNQLHSNVPVIQSESESESKSESKGKKATKAAFVPPTLDEIKAYCAERRSSVNAQKFFDYFDASGWVDSRGKPVLNWKQKLITWENHSDSGKRQAETESDPELDAIF